MLNRNEDLRSRGLCLHFGNGYVPCRNNYWCMGCELADRIRAHAVAQEKTLYFSDSDCLRQTPKGGGANWYQKVILLKPTAFERYNIPLVAVNQFAVAVGGPGVFVSNPVGAVDIRLLVDSRAEYTISRIDAYGIPSLEGCRKIDRLLCMDLERRCYRKDGGLR